MCDCYAPLHFSHNQLLAAPREVTAGWATLDEFEKQPTKTEGIFVMPKEPIIIQSSYVYTPGEDNSCAKNLASLDLRFTSLSKEMERIRASKLPNRK